MGSWEVDNRLPETDPNRPNEPAQETGQPSLLLAAHVLCNTQESLWAGFTHQLVKFIRDDFTHSERGRSRNNSLRLERETSSWLVCQHGYPLPLSLLNNYPVPSQGQADITRPERAAASWGSTQSVAAFQKDACAMVFTHHRLLLCTLS